MKCRRLDEAAGPPAFQLQRAWRDDVVRFWRRNSKHFSGTIDGTANRESSRNVSLGIRRGSMKQNSTTFDSAASPSYFNF